MKIIDLSHEIDNGMPVYPGTPQAKISQSALISQKGYNEKLLSMPSHLGTHIDAPAHIRPVGKTLDQLQPEIYFSRGAVVDISGLNGKPVPREYLQEFDSSFRENEFVLFYSGWDRYWGKDQYFEIFPVLSAQAAAWVSEQGLKGIGLDVCSADPVGSDNLLVHNILLGAGLVIAENLTNLQNLPPDGFYFSCLPLKIKHADGSPIRAVGIVI